MQEPGVSRLVSVDLDEAVKMAASIVVAGVDMARRALRGPRWLPLLGLAYVALFALLGRVYIYYLVPAIPFLAAGATLLLRQVWHDARVGRHILAAVLLAVVLVALVAATSGAQTTVVAESETPITSSAAT